MYLPLAAAQLVKEQNVKDVDALCHLHQYLLILAMMSTVPNAILVMKVRIALTVVLNLHILQQLHHHQHQHQHLAHQLQLLLHQHQHQAHQQQLQRLHLQQLLLIHQPLLQKLLTHQLNLLLFHIVMRLLSQNHVHPLHQLQAAHVALHKSSLSKEHHKEHHAL